MEQLLSRHAFRPEYDAWSMPEERSRGQRPQGDNRADDETDCVERVKTFSVGPENVCVDSVAVIRTSCCTSFRDNARTALAFRPAWQRPLATRVQHRFACCHPHAGLIGQLLLDQGNG